MVEVNQGIVEKSIQHYRENYELDVCQEELAELIQAISKCKRYGCSGAQRDNLIEEMADVTIILETLKQIYDVTDVQLNLEIIRKQERNLERIKNEEEQR